MKTKDIYTKERNYSSAARSHQKHSMLRLCHDCKGGTWWSHATRLCKTKSCQENDITKINHKAACADRHDRSTSSTAREADESELARPAAARPDEWRSTRDRALLRLFREKPDASPREGPRQSSREPLRQSPYIKREGMQLRSASNVAQHCGWMVE